MVSSNLPANLRLVTFRCKEGVEFRRVAQFDFVKPAARVRLGVHEAGIVGGGLVDFHDLAAHGRVDVAGGLDGFDDGAGFAGGELAAHGGQFDEDDVGEFVLGVVGDADGGDVASEAHPFM